MNYRALLSATAIISASFSPFTLITAADAATYAASANPPSSADMQAVCDALDSDGAGTDYQVILTEGTPALGSPTNDLSTITDDESTRVADHSSASSPYGAKSFYSAPGKHGGSVNLFATIGYPGITYAGSLVDQNVDRTETDTYNFTCQVQHYEVVDTQTVDTPAVPPTGCYTNPGHDSCVIGDHWCPDVESVNWGHNVGNCIFNEVTPGQPGGTETEDVYGYANVGTAVPESLTDGPYFYDTVLYAAGASEPTVSVTETDAAPYFAGDVVVCNNPGKKGGTWTAQNGWTDMTKCTTLYFNSAPLISGANVFHSNSLPAL